MSQLRLCLPGIVLRPSFRHRHGPGLKPHPQEGSRMSSKTRVRGLAAVSVVVLAALAACTSGPVRPTAPLSSNGMRPDPSRPPRAGRARANPGRCWTAMPTAATPTCRAIFPGNEAQNVKRIAVLLPFNSTNAEVKKQSEGIYNAIQMALFQVGARDVDPHAARRDQRRPAGHPGHRGRCREGWRGRRHRPGVRPAGCPPSQPRRRKCARPCLPSRPTSRPSAKAPISFR